VFAHTIPLCVCLRAAWCVPDAFGAVESVKAASEIYAPISGSIAAVNEALEDEPSLLNSSPMDDGWLIKVTISNESEIAGTCFAVLCRSTLTLLNQDVCLQERAIASLFLVTSHPLIPSFLSPLPPSSILFLACPIHPLTSTNHDASSSARMHAHAGLMDQATYDALVNDT
jgi:hypothetical protein